MSIDITKTRRGDYDVSWDGVDLGGLDAIDLSKLTMKLDPVKLGSLGVMKLDDRFVALEDGAQITVDIRQIDHSVIMKMNPWSTSGTNAGKVDLVPPINTLMSTTYAKILLLHPRDITGTAQDIKLYLTVPVGPPMSRDGQKDDVWRMTFMVYPDITKLPANPYGEFTA